MAKLNKKEKVKIQKQVSDPYQAEKRARRAALVAEGKWIRRRKTFDEGEDMRECSRNKSSNAYIAEYCR